MIVEVTKQFIIEALETERLELLKPGCWMEVDADVSTSKENCPRCAVGAVVNRVLASSTIAADIFSLSGRITAGALVAPSDEDILEEDDLRDTALEIMHDPLGKPMSALSYFFESCCVLELRVVGRDELEDCSPEEVREVISLARNSTIRFVKEHFPEKVKIDINGFEPAKDVVVVEP